MATGSRPASFGDLLTLLFIGFKLGGVGQVAGWSWVWVLSPLWVTVVGMFLLKLGSRIVARRVANNEVREALRRSSR